MKSLIISILLVPAMGFSYEGCEKDLLTHFSRADNEISVEQKGPLSYLVQEKRLFTYGPIGRSTSDSVSIKWELEVNVLEGSCSIDKVNILDSYIVYN